MNIKLLVLITFCAALSAFKLEKHIFRFPGTSPVVKNFFVDEAEVTNLDWKEYISYLSTTHGADSPVYLNSIPDSTVWYEEGKYLDPYAVTYFRHPAFNAYPVVGISHDQAIAYCKWRTAKVEEHLKSNGVEVPNFAYRLPTQTEWELIASAGYSKKTRKHLNKRERKKSYPGILRAYNMKYEGAKINDFTTVPSRTFPSNKYMVYHIYGNVAEMVAEPNISMGGSYRDLYKDIVLANKEIQYDGPQNWLGFRCVVEVYDN